jgi:hypothetical protein
MRMATMHHRPEQTLLHRIVEDHYPALAEQMSCEGRALPDYVGSEFDGFLLRGRLEHGFLRERCDSCHAERLVAFLCKRRGFCPSCGTPRMAEASALLVDEVFPQRPVAPPFAVACYYAAVLSFPYPLRFLIASRPEVMGKMQDSYSWIRMTFISVSAGNGLKRATEERALVPEVFNPSFHHCVFHRVCIVNPDLALVVDSIKDGIMGDAPVTIHIEKNEISSLG